MNKKTYLAPQMNEVHMAASFQICDGTVTNAGGNAGMVFGGGGNGTPANGGTPRSNERRNDAEWGNLW